MSAPATCSFVLPNGVLCNGLALKDNPRCRFHQEDAERAQKIREATIQRRCDMARYGVGVTSFCKVPGLDEVYDDTSAGLFANLNLPPVDDANSINLIISTVVRALSQQIIPTRNAALMLYGLQIASGNLKRTRKPTPPLDRLTTEPMPPLRDYSDDRLAILEHHSSSQPSSQPSAPSSPTSAPRASQASPSNFSPSNSVLSRSEADSALDSQLERMLLDLGK